MFSFILNNPLTVQRQEADDIMDNVALSESIDYLIMGNVLHTVPIRDPGHKLYLPHRFYPLNVFPRYVGGAGYVVSTSVMPALFECLMRTPYMNLEDVMLMGLCASTQLGLRLTHNPLFRYISLLYIPHENFFNNSSQGEYVLKIFLNIRDILLQILKKVLDIGPIVLATK